MKISSILIFLFFSNITNAQLTYNELKVEFDSAWTFKNLQLIPIKFKNPANELPDNILAATHLLALSEALQKHKVKLQEMQYQNGADVNWLQITNHSKQSVIMQSGQIISGGKQDRMIAETKIVSQGATDYVHVFCVQKKRWDDKPKDFEPKGMANSDLRKKMDLAGRQSEVWKEIDKQFSAQKKTSETLSYLNLYDDSVRTDSSYLHYFTRKYIAGDSSFAGFIFISGDRIISCELFSSAELTGFFFNNMLNSYIHSIMLHGSEPIVKTDDIKQFMNKVLTSESIQKAFVAAHGKEYSDKGKIIHLIAYGD